MTRQFSPFVIGALAEVITGGSANDSTPPIGLYRSASKLEQFFLDCGVMMSVGASSRVPATTEALRNAFSGADGDAVLQRIILRVADPRDYVAVPEMAQAVLDRLNIALEPDGYVVVIANGRPQLVPKGNAGAVVSGFSAKVSLLDFDTVQRDIARALASVNDDPEDAATAACSLIESVCRSILVELNLPMPTKKDIDGLIKAVQEPLRLSPGRSDLPAEIEADIRQILSGLTSVAKGIGALRTHGGDAHGRERGYRRIDPRIARLAINSAASLALFLIETWERTQHKTLRKLAS
jgi:hypothetical protein